MCPPDGNRAESNGAGVPQLRLKLQINLSIGFVVRGAGSVRLPDPWWTESCAVPKFTSTVGIHSLVMFLLPVLSCLLQD